MNDKQIIDLIQYFFPTIDIERDKFIANMRCTIWDKQMDIQIALENIKETFQKKIQDSSNVYQFSIYDILGVLALVHYLLILANANLNRGF